MAGFQEDELEFAGGLRGGKVSSPRQPGVVVNTDRGDLRYQPDTGAMELVAGKSQYGLAYFYSDQISQMPNELFYS